MLCLKGGNTEAVNAGSRWPSTGAPRCLTGLLPVPSALLRVKHSSGSLPWNPTPSGNTGTRSSWTGSGSSKLATSRRGLAPRRTVVGRAGLDQRGAQRAESQHTGVRQRSLRRLPGIAPQDTGGVRGDEGISAGQVGGRLVQALLPVRQPDRPPLSPRRCAEGRRAAAGHRQSWAGGMGTRGWMPRTPEATTLAVPSHRDTAPRASSAWLPNCLRLRWKTWGHRMS